MDRRSAMEHEMAPVIVTGAVLPASKTGTRAEGVAGSHGSPHSMAAPWVAARMA